MAETAIEWATHVWNPVTGCDRVSPGCAHCYALTYAARLKAMGQPKYQRDGGRASGPGFGLTMHEDALDEPSHWRKPRRVFVNSMSDLFHEDVTDEFICKVFDVFRACSVRTAAHQFLVLTKRPERMRDISLRLRFDWRGSGRVWLADEIGKRDGYALQGGLPGCHPLPNVWLGVSIENRRFIHRADVLRQTPAAVRFISAEPLLGPLLFDDGVADWDEHATCWSDDHDGERLDLDEIDWLIVGGESGPEHRRIDEAWVRDLRDAAADAGTAFFFKQWGGRTPKAGGRELDGRTWDELPARAVDEVAHV